MRDVGVRYKWVCGDRAVMKYNTSTTWKQWMYQHESGQTCDNVKHKTETNKKLPVHLYNSPRLNQMKRGSQSSKEYCCRKSNEWMIEKWKKRSKTKWMEMCGKIKSKTCTHTVGAPSSLPPGCHSKPKCQCSSFSVSGYLPGSSR